MNRECCMHAWHPYRWSWTLSTRLIPSFPRMTWKKNAPKYWSTLTALCNAWNGCSIRCMVTESNSPDPTAAIQVLEQTNAEETQTMTSQQMNVLTKNWAGEDHLTTVGAAALQGAAQFTKAGVLQIAAIERSVADMLNKAWTLESTGVNIEERNSQHPNLTFFFEETVKQMDGHYKEALSWKPMSLPQSIRHFLNYPKLCPEYPRCDQELRPTRDSKTCRQYDWSRCRLLHAALGCCTLLSQASGGF